MLGTKKLFLLITASVFLFIHYSNQKAASQEQEEANYDESSVPHYKLPELLETSESVSITTINEWVHLRKPEIISLFTEHVYGKIPTHLDAIAFNTVTDNENAPNIAASFKQVEIVITKDQKSLTIEFDIFIPNNVKQPVPITVLINHRGPEYVDVTRQTKKGYWPAEMILARGYAAAVFNVNNVANDDPDSFSKDIIETLYPEQLEMNDGMRALSAWAWGAMRVMDYIEIDSALDESRAILVGHSRSGKAALWAGANDERWDITVANESGAGGAALSKRRFGETVEIINNGFPYWFTPNFEKYNRNEAELPLDQHMLIACMAPRGVYITAAEEDKWADPKGMYLALYHASRVYEHIYGISTLLDKRMPFVNNPSDNRYAAFHIRSGEHDLKRYDWIQFFNFADRHFHLSTNN